jgi:capsid protein
MNAPTRQQGVPFKPDYAAAGSRPAVHLERACIASAMAVIRKSYDTSIARDRWADDQVVPLLLRAATAPAALTDAGWAGTLARQVVGDFVSSLQPISAAAKLFAAAPSASLDGVATISFPKRASPIAASDVMWVSEAGVVPVKKYPITGVQLGPTKKLGVIVAATRQLMESSSAESALTLMLRESAAFSLDASVFSSTAASASRPAGILNGIAPLTATAGGQDDALSSDLEKLAAAIAPVSSGIAFIMNPRQGYSVRIRRGSTFARDIPIWTTTAVAEGTLIALDPAAIVSAFGVTPEIRSSIEVSLHLEDTAPAHIGTPGTPNVVAAPAHSMWQIDGVATRLLLPAAWAVRSPGAIAWLASATWG